MKKIFYKIACISVIFCLSGCNRKVPSPPDPVHHPEKDASWFVNNIVKGDVNKASEIVYIPENIKDKESYINSVKEVLIRQKAEIDAGGGVEKMVVKEAIIKFSIKLKNNPSVIEKSMKMVNIGKNRAYRVVMP